MSAHDATLARVAARVRERGIAATLRKAFADHVYRSSMSVIVEYRDGWGVIGSNAALPDWLRFIVVRHGDPIPPLSEWLAWRGRDFAAMRDAGKVGVFALNNGVAVGCVWLALSDHHDPVSREFYAIAPNEAYHYCWLVDPSDRRRNVALPLCRHVMAVLTRLGIKRQFGVVDRVNRASYLIQTRFGYREAGVKVMHYRLFGFRWTRMARYDGVLGLAPDAR